MSKPPSTEHLIGYTIGRLLLWPLFMWACWSLPDAYFMPAVLGLWFLSAK